MSCRFHGSFNYDLYLPDDFYTPPDRSILLFICSPYSAPDQASLMENIAMAERIGLTVIEYGFNVIIPQKNSLNFHLYNQQLCLTYDDWMSMTKELLRTCHAMCVNSSSPLSSGMILEHNFAYNHNKPIIQAHLNVSR